MNSGKPDYLMYSVRLYFIGIDRIGLVGWLACFRVDVGVLLR